RGTWPRAYFITRSKCACSSTLLKNGNAAENVKTRTAATAQNNRINFRSCRIAFRTAVSLSMPLDHREIAIFVKHGPRACHLQKARLQRTPKRRIALENNRKMVPRIRFSPWDCRRINPMLVSKDRIGDGEHFTAFEQQRIKKKNRR